MLEVQRGEGRSIYLLEDPEQGRRGRGKGLIVKGETGYYHVQWISKKKYPEL